MHPISDKELDKLFQQRFEEAEIVPSASVWEKINDKMDGHKRIRPWSSFWIAAASVVLFIGAGLWFYRPVEVIRLQGASPVALNNTGEHIQPVEIKEETSTTVSKRQSIEFNWHKSAATDAPNLIETPVSELNITPNADQTPVTIASTVKKVNTPVSQRKQELKIPARYTGDQSNLDVTQPDMLAKTEIPEQDITVDEAPGRRHKKVRSIGSLVNFVVGQVDRRDDKIIEFKDSEEGSEISGINLGLIKIKSKK